MDFLLSWAIYDFDQISGQIVAVRLKILSNRNLVAPRHNSREKVGAPNENITQNHLNIELLNVF